MKKKTWIELDKKGSGGRGRVFGPRRPRAAGRLYKEGAKGFSFDHKEDREGHLRNGGSSVLLFLLFFLFGSLTSP